MDIRTDSRMHEQHEQLCVSRQGYQHSRSTVNPENIRYTSDLMAKMLLRKNPSRWVIAEAGGRD